MIVKSAAVTGCVATGSGIFDLQERNEQGRVFGTLSQQMQ